MHWRRSTRSIEAGAPGEATGAGHVPTLPLQVNALQALCRQLFGFRLAMIAIAAPFALTTAENGLAAWLVGAAVFVTFMVSYVLMRDWERFGPVLLRHPSLLALDMLFGALLLFTASPNSTLGVVTVCTPLLAGLVYSWRGAGIFAALQILLLATAYAVNPDAHATSSALLLVAGCALAGAVGGTLRGLLLRFGAASQALTETRARLAVNEAVEAERARLARDMHDSVAKTLHGLSLAAEGLAESADRMEPMTVKHQAGLVARAARRAAAESRELLSDLRRESGLDTSVDIAAELSAHTAEFRARSGLRAVYLPQGGPHIPPVPHAVARQLLTIADEAMENAHRHARAGQLDVSAGVDGDQLVISVHDDGTGLPPGLTLDALRRGGHFGLVGMVERAAAVGARIRVGRGAATTGTEVRIDVPLAALAPGAPTPRATPAGLPALPAPRAPAGPGTPASGGPAPGGPLPGGPLPGGPLPGGPPRDTPPGAGAGA